MSDLDSEWKASKLAPGPQTLQTSVIDGPLGPEEKASRGHTPPAVPVPGQSPLLSGPASCLRLGLLQEEMAAGEILGRAHGQGHTLHALLPQAPQAHSPGEETEAQGPILQPKRWNWD